MIKVTLAAGACSGPAGISTDSGCGADDGCPSRREMLTLHHCNEAESEQRAANRRG